MAEEGIDRDKDGRPVHGGSGVPGVPIEEVLGRERVKDLAVPGTPPVWRNGPLCDCRRA